MYNKQVMPKTTIGKGTNYAGESIEAKVRRVMRNKEPIKDGAPIIFMDRREGVPPAYNIRTDRWDLALEATDAIGKARLAKREGAADKPTNLEKTTDGKPESPAA